MVEDPGRERPAMPAANQREAKRGVVQTAVSCAGLGVRAVMLAVTVVVPALAPLQ